jgi:hypothetical protein
MPSHVRPSGCRNPKLSLRILKCHREDSIGKPGKSRLLERHCFLIVLNVDAADSSNRHRRAAAVEVRTPRRCHLQSIEVPNRARTRFRNHCDPRAGRPRQRGRSTAWRRCRFRGPPVSPERRQANGLPKDGVPRILGRGRAAIPRRRSRRRSAIRLAYRRVPDLPARRELGGRKRLPSR